MVDTNSIAQLRSIDFNNNLGLAVGHKIYKSNDGGNSWIFKYDYAPNFIMDINVLNSNISYSVESSGKVLKTNDGGETWFELNLNANGSLFSLFFSDTLNGYVCGYDGFLSKTTDGGLNWQTNIIGGRDLIDMTFINDSIGFIAGGYNDFPYYIDGALYKTIDSGKTWTAKLWNDAILIALDFPNPMVGYTCSNNGDIFKTIDGGETWTQIPFLNSSTLYSMKFLSADTGFAVGTGPYLPGIVYKTVDGGITWTIEYNLQSIPLFGHLMGIKVLNKNLMYAVGDYSLILKFDNTTKIEDYSNENDFLLFPNPTKGNFKFNVRRDFGTICSLKIFNCTGKIILLKHYDLNSIGNIISLDLSSFNSGLYFIELVGDKEIIKRKLIIEKN